MSCSDNNHNGRFLCKKSNVLSAASFFQVDESGYAAIVKQVRDKEFGKELADREQQFANEKISAVKLARAEAERDYRDLAAKQKEEILALQAQVASLEQREKQFVSDKESAWIIRRNRHLFQ